MFRLFDPGLGSLVGVILAGGGTRCLAPLAGDPLIAHVIRRLGRQVDALIIATDPPIERFAAFGLPVVADTAGTSGGPLAGLHAGLVWARSHLSRVRGIVTVSGDVPFLPTDLVKRLTSGPGDRTGVAERSGILQPMFAYWPLSLEAALHDTLRSGESRVKPTIEAMPHHRVRFDGPEDPFFDPESPEDWAAAEARLALARA